MLTVALEVKTLRGKFFSNTVNYLKEGSVKSLENMLLD